MNTNKNVGTQIMKNEYQTSTITPKTSMEIIIIVNGVERKYSGDYDTLHNNDWSDIIRELIDGNVSYEKDHDKD